MPRKSTMELERPNTQAAQDSVIALLRFIDEDPAREGLRDTPRRVVKAWRELTEGYQQNPAAILGTTFSANGYDEMIICRGIEFVSTCEHHLLPFTGIAHVGYVPRKKIVGLSKMARLVDCYSRRLQIQEQLTIQISHLMQIVLNPRGVGVLIQASHSCMACRGVRKQQSEMITCSLLGVFKKPEVRAEFLAHCHA